METNILNAYTAGLIDGEGTITLSYSKKQDKYRQPVVSVTSTTYGLLTFLQDRYKGHICKHKVYKEHHKQSWTWIATRDCAIAIINDILPYMREPDKIYRGNLIISKYKSVTPRNGRYSEQQLKDKLQFEQDFFHPSNTID